MEALELSKSRMAFYFQNKAIKGMFVEIYSQGSADLGPEPKLLAISTVLFLSSNTSQMTQPNKVIKYFENQNKIKMSNKKLWDTANIYGGQFLIQNIYTR